jgi:cell division transport system permease protein
LASALVMLGLSLLNGPVTRLAQSYGSTFRLMTPGLAEAGALLTAGALLGLLGSAIAASRHLARIEPRA